MGEARRGKRNERQEGKGYEREGSEGKPESGRGERKGGVANLQ